MTPQPRSLHNSPRVKRPSVIWKDFENDEGLQAYFNSKFTKHLIEHLEKAGEQLKFNTDYDCPCWAYKQADINGRLAIIKLIKDLLTNG